MKSTWQTTKLGNLAQYINGRGFKKSEWRDEGVPIIRIQNLTGSTEKINFFTGKLDEKHHIHKGNLLLSWAATLDVYEFDQDEGALNQHIFKVIPKPNVDQKFLYYLLKNKLADLYAQTHGSGMVHITAGKFKSTPAVLPPPDEQLKIVAKIEELFSELDNSTQLIKNTGLRAAMLKQSLLHDVFSEQGSTTKMIEEIAKVGTGSTPLRTNSQFWENGSVPWITSGALNKDFVVGADQFVTELAVKNSRLKINPPNTLLVALYGEGKTRGKCSELSFEATTNQAIATIVLDDNNEIDRKYLKWFLTMNYERVRQLSAGGVQPNLNLGIIKKIKLPWPPREVKKAIIDKLDTSFTEIEHSKAEVLLMSKKIEALRHTVLLKAFKGELI